MTKRNHKKIWFCLLLLCCSLAVISGIIYINQLMIRNNAEKDREKLKSQVNSTEASIVNDINDSMTLVDFGQDIFEDDKQRIDWSSMTQEDKYQYYLDNYGIVIPEKNIDFAKLQEEKNADIYAWVYVPGTNVDDPVVHHPSDDTYYLNYNLDGTKGYPGGIYTESCNTKDFTDRMTVIYGHNMKNGKGFGSLHQFEDTDFFNDNRYIFIYMPDDILVYEIFACYEGSSNHLIYGHEWDEESWVQYLNDTLLSVWDKHNSLESYDFTADSKVLTLVTCVRNSPNERYQVQGVLLNADR